MSEALASLPYDHLMDPDLTRAIWDSPPLGPRRIGVFYDRDRPVGVVPLEKRGLMSWQLLTEFVMPYAAFHVLPEYVDAALWSLGRYVDSTDVVFPRLPSDPALTRPEESWVIELGVPYAELLRRCDYVHEDRRCRKKSAALTVHVDQFEDLPEALARWSEKWSGRGHAETACRKAQLMASFQAMAAAGKLKTFTLRHQGRFAGMNIHYVGPETVYFMVTVALDEFRSQYVGVRTILEALEWACGAGARSFDMLTQGAHYKKKWATPTCKAHRLMVGPGRSSTVAKGMERAEALYWRALYKAGLAR